MASFDPNDARHFKQIPLTSEEQKELDDDLALEENLPDDDVCCCGALMEGHSMWDNHMPLSMRDHYLKDKK